MAVLEYSGTAHAQDAPWLHGPSLKRGKVRPTVPPWCTLGSAVLPEFFLQNGST